MSDSVPNNKPFGLRYLVEPHPSSAADLNLADVKFDDVAQIAVVHCGPGQMPLFKHTSSQTSTTTNTQDRQTADSDTDYEQDK